MLITGLFILLLVSAVSHERINGIILNRASALILVYSFILSINTLNVSIIGSGIGLYGGLYQITVVSKVVEGFLYLLAAIILASLTAKPNLNATSARASLPEALQAVPSKSSEYSVIALFTVVGGVLLISSNDLVSMYLSIELQSFGLYVLATIYRDSQSATYAGLKYFLLGGLSSGFILLGSSILYGYTGTTNLEAIYLLVGTLGGIGTSSEIVSSGSEASSLASADLFKFIEIGILVTTVGFLFKIASAPFHNWAPDVYDGVPTKVTTWLAIMAKISILTFLLDLTVGITASGQTIIKGSPLGENYLRDALEQGVVASQAFTFSLTSLFLICSVLSLLIGTIVGLAQSRIKRLLSYSTISHVGFLLLAIAINTEDSIESFIFYLIQYSLTSANAFFVLIAFGTAQTLFLEKGTEDEDSPIQFISQLKGQFFINPLLALSMAVTLFSMAGIPPLVGFFAKQAVLLAAVKNGFVFLALVGIVTSVISAGYYLRVIKVMHFEGFDYSKGTLDFSNPRNKEDLSGPVSLPAFPLTASEVNFVSMSNSLSFSISVLTLLTLLFVLKPTLILNSAHIMALSLFYL